MRNQHEGVATSTSPSATEMRCIGSVQETWHGAAVTGLPRAELVQSLRLCGRGGQGGRERKTGRGGETRMIKGKERARLQTS